MKSLIGLLVLIGLSSVAGAQQGVETYDCNSPPPASGRVGYRVDGPAVNQRTCFKTLEAAERFIRSAQFGNGANLAAGLAFPTNEGLPGAGLPGAGQPGQFRDWILDYRAGGSLAGSHSRPPEEFTGPFFKVRAPNWPPPITAGQYCNGSCPFGASLWQDVPGAGGWCRTTGKGDPIDPELERVRQCAASTWPFGGTVQGQGGYRWSVNLVQLLGPGFGTPTSTSGLTWPPIDPSGRNRSGGTYLYAASASNAPGSTGRRIAASMSRATPSSYVEAAPKEAQVIEWPVEQREPFFCPVGYQATGQYPNPCTAGIKLFIYTNVSPPTNECKYGNPCAPGSGNKQIHEFDFEYAGLRFERHYNSVRHLRVHGFMGPSWSHSFAPRVMTSALHPGHPLPVSIMNERGEIEVFSPDTGASNRYKSMVDTGSILDYIPGTASPPVAPRWRLLRSDGLVDMFDDSGRITQRVDRDNPSRTMRFEYDVTRTDLTDDRYWRLERVRLATGRGLNFNYSSAYSSRLQTITTESNSTLLTIEYGSENDRIFRVIHPDGRQRYYHYDLTGNGPNLPYHITGITDERGIRVADYRYDEWGRVTDSWHGGGLNAGLVTIAYPSDGTATVTNSLGRTSTLQFAAGPFRRVGATEDPTLPPMSQTFDSVNGRLQSRTDRRGLHTEFVYDPLGRQTEAKARWGVTGPYLRRIRSEYHPTHNRLSSRHVERWESGNWLEEQRTVMQYSSLGQLESRTVSEVINGNITKSRTWTYLYCNAADVSAGHCPAETAGEPKLLRSINGPRIDVADVILFTYYTNTDTSGCLSTTGPCHHAGDLRQTINALGHVTEISRYSLFGKPARVIDENGVLTELVYDPSRGWLTQRIVRGATTADDSVTAFTHDEIGNVTSVTYPDGVITRYVYDDASRLVRICDNTSDAACTTGNRIVYTLDAQGNRVREQTFGASTLQRALARQFDTLGQLRSEINAPWALQSNLDDPSVVKTQYTYDANGNLDLTTDPAGVVADNDYDELGRLWRTIADKGTGKADINATTEYRYDARDNLRLVRDPKGLDTQYGYDGLDNLVSLTSPDTGVSSYLYDEAGNRIQQTDARGVISIMGYDALNRLRTISYPSDPSRNVAFFYDESDGTTGCSGSFSIGRLTRFTDHSGSTSLCYDRRGNVIRKRQTILSTVLTTEYTFTVGDRPETITYPGGARVRYARTNSLRQVNAVFWRHAGATNETTIASAISYKPMGPVEQVTFGNSRVLTKTYDQNYWIDTVVGGPTGLNLDFSIDSRGRVASVLSGTPTQNRIYTQDDLGRLTRADNGAGAMVEQYSYDATGNRLTAQQAGQPQSTYQYDPSSHRLQAVGTFTRNYDANGNTVGNYFGTNAYTYDVRNRMAQFVSPGLGTDYYEHYRYNARGERVLKDRQGFVFDQAGRLLIETERCTCLGPGCVGNPTYCGGGIEMRGAMAGPKSTGLIARQYVWLDDMPIAFVDGTSIYYVESDHLNSPRALIDPVRNVSVWRWDLHASAFGVGGVQPDPDGDGVGITYNLRFPGQYLDSGTGLHYNYFRDYEPAIGRYVQSDPLGLQGGTSTYAYVTSGPLSAVDRFGLFQNTDGLAEVCIKGTIGVGTRLATGIGMLITPTSTSECQDASPPPDSDCAQNCPPCDPPVGTIGYRLDDSPDSPPHFDKTTQQYIPTPHLALFIRQQSPPSRGCKCFWHPLKSVVRPPPDPSWYKLQKVR